jgi:hypothetical protein
LWGGLKVAYQAHPVFVVIAAVSVLAFFTFGWWSSEFGGVEDPDPSLTVSCYAEPNQEPDCFQGYGKTQVESVEAGDSCGDGMVWTEPSFAPLVETQTDYVCE